MTKIKKRKKRFYIYGLRHALRRLCLCFVYGGIQLCDRPNANVTPKRTGTLCIVTLVSTVPLNNIVQHVSIVRKHFCRKNLDFLKDLLVRIDRNAKKTKGDIIQHQIHISAM